MRSLIGVVVAVGAIAALAWAFGLPVARTVVAVIGLTLVWFHGRQTGRSQGLDELSQRVNTLLGPRPHDASRN